MSTSTGHIIKVVGPVVDVEFPLNEELPAINNALHVKKSETETITLEVLN